MKVGGAGCKLTVYKWTRKAVQIADKTDKDKPAIITTNGATIKSGGAAPEPMQTDQEKGDQKKSVMLDSNSNTFVSCANAV